MKSIRKNPKERSTNSAEAIFSRLKNYKELDISNLAKSHGEGTGVITNRQIWITGTIALGFLAVVGLIVSFPC